MDGVGPTARTPSVALPPDEPAVADGAIVSDTGWRAVAAAFAINGALFGVWASRVPAFKEAFGLGEAALGVVLLCLAGGAIAAFPVAGHLSERWGPHTTTLRAALLYAPALMLIALAPSPVLLGIALFAFGALHGGMDVAMNGWAARVEDRLARPTMSVFHALFSLGAGVGAASGFFAVRAGLDPPAHFVLAAFVGLALSWPLMHRGVAIYRHAPSTDDGPLVALPRGPLLLVGLIAFGVAMGEGAMADWSAVFLREVLDVGEGRAALGYAAFSATMVLTRLMGDRVTAHAGPVSTARGSGLLAALGLAVVVLAPTAGVALVGFALVGCGYAIVMPLVFSRAAHDPRMAPGPAIAAVASLAYGGMLLGPALVGFAAAATSLPVSFGLLAVLAMLSAALAGNLRPGNPQTKTMRPPRAKPLPDADGASR